MQNLKPRQHSFSDKKLETLQRLTFDYFLKETNPENGLVPDSTRQGAPCSIAPTGFALAAYPVGVERGFITRNDAIKRTLTTLRFFWNSPQGPEPDATGYKGFYYHFLDMKTGRRTWNCELSTIDSTFLIAGALTAAEYFNRDTEDEREIRTLADAIYRRADWQWAQNRGVTVTHGWRPETRIHQVSLAGLQRSPDSLRPRSRLADPSVARKELPGMDQRLTSGRSFTVTSFSTPVRSSSISFRTCGSIFAAFRTSTCANKAIDYFENSRRATYIQQQYAIRNPRGFKGYGEYIWGLTASDGPGPASKKIGGKLRRFYDYKARGVPNGPDDGTLAPWAVVASLPFAPEIVLPSIQYFDETFPEMTSKYGFKCSFNPTFSTALKQGMDLKGLLRSGSGPDSFDD